MEAETKERTVVSSSADMTGGKNISTQINRDFSFWIRTEDGKEKEFHLGSTKIPLRSGHKITIVFAEKEDADTRHIAEILNHTTGENLTISKPDVMLLEKLDLTGSNIIHGIAMFLPMIICFFYLKSIFGAESSLDVIGYILIGIGSFIAGTITVYIFGVTMNILTKMKFEPTYKKELQSYLSSIEQS